MAETKAGELAEPSFASVLERISELRVKYELTALAARLEACDALLKEGDLINVGVLGRFKAGKSSLLNCLCGRSVLPVGVTPVTAVITRIRYGPAERAVVHHLGGRDEEVPVDNVRLYVSESENPQNRKKVGSVTVQLPSMKRYQGLQFVDTPGLDSIFQHNTESALNWLPKVGLALVTISVDPPLSRQDVDLIRTLREYTPKIAIVLTKADLLSEADREEVEAFVSERLRSEFETEFRLFPFSVRPTYGDLQGMLDRGLLQPLLQDGENVRGDLLRFKFSALLTQTRDYLSMALAAAEKADTDRDRLKTQILDEKTSFESIRMELTALGRELAGQTRPWIMKRMKELEAGLGERLGTELSGKLAGLAGNLWKLSRAYEAWLAEAVTREMNEISGSEAELFCVPLEKALATFTRSVQGFRDRLAGNILQALGMRFTPEPFEVEVKRPSRPNISIGGLFMIDIDLLWFLIPMTIFRPWIEKRLLARIPEEVHKNLSRLASQWTDAINASMDRIEKAAIRSVQDQISTVESLLSKTQSEAQHIGEDLQDIELQLASVRS